MDECEVIHSVQRVHTVHWIAKNCVVDEQNWVEDDVVRGTFEKRRLLVATAHIGWMNKH